MATTNAGIPGAALTRVPAEVFDGPELVVDAPSVVDELLELVSFLHS